MKKETLIQIIIAACALLFFYAAGSKLMNYEQSKHEMFKQIFPRSVGVVLVVLVPVIELIVVLLLLVKATRLKGLYASLILLILFTLYIAIALSGIFGRKPCSCGGILKHLGYWTHLGFNLIFIVLAILGIALEKQWKPMNRWFHFVNGKEGTGLY
jgi:putative oxidoreductase